MICPVVATSGNVVTVVDVDELELLLDDDDDEDEEDDDVATVCAVPRTFSRLAPTPIRAAPSLNR